MKAKQIQKLNIEISTNDAEPNSSMSSTMTANQCGLPKDISFHDQNEMDESEYSMSMSFSEDIEHDRCKNDKNFKKKLSWQSSLSSTASLELETIEKEQKQQRQQQVQLSSSQSELPSFHESYNLGTELGEGAFGKVRRCFMKKTASSKSVVSSTSNCSSFAVKSVPAEKFSDNEIEVLEILTDCPNIVHVEDVFHDSNESFIVMEAAEGGDLLGRLKEKVVYSEAEAKILFKTLLETIKFCHDHGVAHCDIKPENCLLVSEEDDTTMRLTDFGLSKIFRHADGKTERFFDMNGSAEYAAPEVFHRSDDDEEGYDERCDIWSAGVVLYTLLGGYCPFDAESPHALLRKVARGKFKFHKRYWKEISIEAKNLITSMLQVDPNDRCSIEAALESPWFVQC